VKNVPVFFTDIEGPEKRSLQRSEKMRVMPRFAVQGGHRRFRRDECFRALHPYPVKRTTLPHGIPGGGGSFGRSKARKSRRSLQLHRFRDVLAWARQTFKEVEFLAALREVEQGGGHPFEDFIDEIERIAQGKE
jgi:hypothetical protein